MQDASDATVKPHRPLTEVIRDVKNAQADRDDVVVDLGEAHRMRLEMLAAELEPVFADVPAGIENFDFAISSGLQPRLWIDAVSHVAMGRDRRTYRFQKDTRAGRVVLAESTDMRPITDQVTRYIAERVVEHHRLMEGGARPVAMHAAAAQPPKQSGWTSLLAGFGLFAAGALLGFGVTAALLWDRLVAFWATL